MANHGSRTSVKNRRDDIITTYQECGDANTRYTVVCPEDETSPAWINAIEIDLDFWVITVFGWCTPKPPLASSRPQLSAFFELHLQPTISIQFE